MTRQEAISALSYWGHPCIVPAYVLDALDAAKLGDDERPLDTAIRIACGQRIYVAPFDHAAIRRLVAMAEIALATEGNTR